MDSHQYHITDQAAICNILESLHEFSQLPIQLIDQQGKVLESYGHTCNYCKIVQKHLQSTEPCHRICADAAQRAIDLGETYLFSCHANLNAIAFPLVSKSDLLGSVIIGPFLMDAPDSTLVIGLDKRFGMNTTTLLDLYEELDSIQVIPPGRVTHLSRLLYFLFADLISEGIHTLTANHDKLMQQSRINESIQTLKTQPYTASHTYPIDLEQKLITKVKLGNSKEAKAILNKLLGYVFFSEGSSLTYIKARAIELCSLLSRAAIEGGATSDSIFRISNQFLMSQNNIHTIDDLCYQLQKTVETFTQCVFDHIPGKNNDLIKKAIQYISQNFSTGITLNDVAEHVHLNPAYFSTVFKQATGSSFKEYLNMVRIEESKRLLAATGYSIIDISVAVGFEDQSYFSKVFKKYTGLTPKQYRQA